jgi:peptide/nickel transport system substrate-binding protein
MPERVARTDANAQITDPTGGGPFRFVTDERLPGSRSVYARFEGYVPRPDGTTSFLAGPRVVHFDRTVWTFQPDAATAPRLCNKASSIGGKTPRSIWWHCRGAIAIWWST